MAVIDHTPLHTPSTPSLAWERAKINAALPHHREGRLLEAEAIYREVLQTNPQYPDALALLGLVCNSTQRSDQALQLLNQVIALAPHPNFYVNRSTVMLTLRHYEHAANDAKLALGLQPDNEDAYINLIGAYRNLKQNKKAVQTGREAVKRFPQNANIWNNLGACLLDGGQLGPAREAFVEAVKRSPLHLVANENIAKIDWHTNAIDSAIAHSQLALDMGTSDVQVLVPWAMVLLKQGLRDKAQPLLTKAALMGAASDLAPWLEVVDFVNAMFGVSSAMQRRRQDDPACAVLRRLTDIKPLDANIWNNLGVAYFSAQKQAQALECFQKAVALDPDQATLMRNIGVCHFLLLQPEEALAQFKLAYAKDPASCSTLLYYYGQCLQCCDWSELAVLTQRLLDVSLQTKPDDLTASLAYLMAVESADTMRIISEKVGASLFARVEVPDFKPFKARTIPKTKGRRLRVGYFSYDFRTHPVSYLTEELYGLHDRSRFEIYALSYGPDDGSALRQTIERTVDHFIELRDLAAEEMAARIKALDLDIVVDLTGNTQGGQSAVLAYRVAPVQCHWLGYVWAMGHKAFDYIIADPFSIPPSLEKGYVEKAARLPITLQIASRHLKASDRVLTRAEMGLPEDAFVFANFGSFAKLQPKLFEVWMKALHAVPNSVLWLARTHRTPQSAFHRLNQEVLRHGIAPERVIYSEPLSREDHLLRYQLADLSLDTYPQGSGTTAIESLWMGCPMLSMAGAGETLAIRMAGGILNAVDLPQLVVNSADAYLAKAIDLARHPDQVKAMRQHLLDNQLSLPMFDTPRTVRYLESAFETMAGINRKGKGPQSFTVPL